jgi:hypothetical protein
MPGPVSVVLYSLEMWAVLRLITLLWEVGSGTLATPSVTRYSIWICLPFTLAGLFSGFRKCPKRLPAIRITTATDPFFIDSYAVQSRYQQGFELKFEMLATLPYSGKKLAVGSVNYHQDFFGRSFAIETGAGPAHTACFGVGLERLALAFLAQYGPDEKNWPEAARHG